jgi:hypothetical protein
MVAEMVDAVIGIDTHRDNHEVEIADPRGTPIATLRIGNDTAGFTQLLAPIAELTARGLVARGGVEPPTFRFSGAILLDDCCADLGPPAVRLCRRGALAVRHGTGYGD